MAVVEESHAIEPMLLRADDFNGFFQARTERMMEIIEKAMGKTISREEYQVEGEDIGEEEEDLLDSVESEEPLASSM